MTRPRSFRDDLRKRVSEALFIYLVGVSKRRCFGDLQYFGSQACDLHKRIKSDRVALGPPGIRREVRVHTTVLAGHWQR